MPMMHHFARVIRSDSFPGGVTKIISSSQLLTNPTQRFELSIECSVPLAKHVHANRLPVDLITRSNSAGHRDKTNILLAEKYWISAANGASLLASCGAPSAFRGSCPAGFSASAGLRW